MGYSFTPSTLKFSLEIFPPKSSDGMVKLRHTLEAYSAYDPAYITVTFGAGGGVENVDQSRDLIRRLVSMGTTPIAAHIICAGRSRADVDAIVDGFYTDGVRRFVALRGDVLQRSGPYTAHPDGYAHTYDFIAGIRARHPDVHISVAGYPEKHPESATLRQDLDHLKRKVDAGADSILTQFFFDPEVFLRWRDVVQARGIAVPIIPGILPILNFQKAVSFADKCGAQVPAFLHRMFEGVAPDSLDHKLLAMNVLSHQVTRLIEHGVTTFHFYTLNDTILLRHLCTWMRAAF